MEIRQDFPTWDFCAELFAEAWIDNQVPETVMFPSLWTGAQFDEAALDEALGLLSSYSSRSEATRSVDDTNSNTSNRIASRSGDSGTCSYNCETKHRPTCPQCSATFNRKYDVKRHVHTHHGHITKQLHKCQVCFKGFGRKDSLARHVQNIHSVPNGLAKNMELRRNH